MGWGDEVLAAGQAETWYRTRKQASVILDRFNKPRWHPLWEGNPAIVPPDNAWLAKHAITNGPHVRPYLHSITEEGGWKFNTDFHARDHIAKIYLTDEEKALGDALHASIGDYVLIDPWSKHTNLRWPLSYWQTLINQRPDLNWVQHLWGQAPRLENVTVVETPSFRAACGVVARAQVYVRGESGMQHAAAALDIPNVAIWGGCMDWDVLGGYPKQLGVGVRDRFCGCYLPCEHCRLTMLEIMPNDVSRAIDLVRHGLR